MGKLLSTLQLSNFEDLAVALGPESAAVRELSSLFSLADAYGIREWLVLDLSVVRGLAYYTGVVFEGFDRSGELRAIFGGGRYDRLLGTFGGENMPAAGFGFGDAVIMELLSMKGLVPPLSSCELEAVVWPFDEDLRPQAMQIAAALRSAGKRVDMVLDSGKKAKWLFKHADRLQAKYVVMLAPQEAAQGLVRVKCLADGKQVDVPFSDVPNVIIS